MNIIEGRKLPMVAGQSSILWSDDDRRIRIECHGETWSLHSECEGGEDGDGQIVYTDGSVQLSAWLSWWWIDLELTNSTAAHIQSKGSTAMPKQSKPVKVARGRGWWVALAFEFDGSSEPFLSIEMKRPLSAEELFAFVKRFAMWSAARTEES